MYAAMVTITIADDHAAVRSSLKKILLQEPNLTITEATNGGMLLQQLKKAPPHALLLDFSLPGQTGIELLARLKKDYPALPVLVMSMHADDDYKEMLLKEGATHILKKENLNDEVMEALKKVLARELQLPNPANLPAHHVNTKR